MNATGRKRRKILVAIGLGLGLALLLALGGTVVEEAFSPLVETITGRHPRPAAVSEEKMLSDWKEMRERAKRQPLEGQ